MATGSSLVVVSLEPVLLDCADDYSSVLFFLFWLSSVTTFDPVLLPDPDDVVLGIGIGIGLMCSYSPVCLCFLFASSSAASAAGASGHLLYLLLLVICGRPIPNHVK